jgi:hypothetical protein
MPKTATQAPVGEAGLVAPGAQSPFGGALSSGLFVDDREYVDAFRWPRSVETVERMRTDSQLAGLERGTILPPTRWAWGIDPNDAPPDMVERVCREFNLPLIDDAVKERRTGRPARAVGRVKNRFNFAEHQRLAFRAIRYGHYYFVQKADVVRDGPAGLNGGWFAHLKKLKPLPPWSIGQIEVDTVTGGLKWIKQQVTLDSPQLDVSRLVAYVWDQEPGNWVGTSMYRACYREWKRKDVLLKIDAVNHEKAGGVWWGEAAPNATQAEVAELAGLAVKAGAGGGAAVPAGAKLHLERPGGGGPTTIDSINRDDEAMARAWLLMVIQLGQTQSGARAVGDNFETLHGHFQESLALWFQGVFNEHVIEDWADWNYGDVEFVPRLVFVRPENYSPTADLETAAANDPAIAKAVDQVKAAIASGELDEQLGERVSRRTRPSARAASTDPAVPLPDRPLRRDPFEHEVRAAADFKQIDENWANTVAQLVADWQAIRAAQITELHDLIADADGDLVQLAQIQATAAGGDLIAERLRQMAETGAGEAVAEAIRQGKTDATTPDLGDLAAELAARAAALEQLMVSALSQAAATEAIRLTGGSLTAAEVAAATATHLDGLSDVFLTDQFGGAMSAAQNGGRLSAMEHNQASHIYASELLDVNTCTPCAEEDGKVFASRAAAAVDYPAGGYKECQGRLRCRGTLVAVYEEAAPSA